MNRNEILEKTIIIFKDVFSGKDIIINENTNSSEIEDWDSLSHITLISACEEEFGVKFGINDIFKFKSVSDFVDCIEKKNNLRSISKI